jgi:hypothetical protein
MKHKWKWVGETTGSESFWCEVCGALGYGFRTEGIKVEALPEATAGQEPVCVE